jgi:hypothetical protein
MNVTFDPRTVPVAGSSATENVSKEQASAFGAMVERNEPPMQLAQRGRQPEVYVMDDFGTSRYAPGVGHGEVVAGMILGNTGVMPRGIDLNTGNDGPSTQMAVMARELRQIMGPGGRRLDNVYINISYGVDAQAISASPRVWGVLKGLIEEATRRGATIVVATGNDYVNEIAKIEGVTGAGGPRGVYVESPFIDARDNATVTITPVGPNAADLTGDGRPDVALPGGPGSLRRTTLKGTSFAAPDVLSNRINRNR